MANRPVVSTTLRVDSPDAAQRAAKVVQDGGVIVYPTSTVYGIGGDASDPTVSERVHHIKGTPVGKPHLIITDEWGRLEDWIAAPSSQVLSLMELGVELPITILFEMGDGCPEHLAGPSRKLGVRRTRHPFCRLLIRAAGCALVSSSANRTGSPPPKSFEDIDSAILDETDLAVAGGPGSGRASSIVTVEDGEIILIREGDITREALISRIKQV